MICLEGNINREHLFWSSGLPPHYIAEYSLKQFVLIRFNNVSGLFEEPNFENNALKDLKNLTLF